MYMDIHHTPATYKWSIDHLNRDETKANVIVYLHYTTLLDTKKQDENILFNLVC